MREQLPANMTETGKNYSDFDGAIAALRRGDHLPADAAKRPQLAGMAWVGPAGIAYLVELDAIDPVKTISKVTQPVLILQGERDFSVPPHHAFALMKARQPANTQLKLFPNLQHCYKKVPASIEFEPSASLGLDTESDPEVSNTMDLWLRSLK
jgi:pimeloyl-ACP methyl ester carboxylesterase